MNRWDEVQGAARDIADWVCADPADRNRMADDLIKLVCLVVQGVGKGVAIEGESELNDVHASAFELDTMSIEYSDDERARLEAEFEQEKATDAAKAHNRYLLGEEIQNAARTVQEEATGADLERYERSGLKPVWVAQGNAGRLTAAANQAAEAVQGTAHENDARPRDERPALFAPGAEAYYRKVLGLDRPDVAPSFPGGVQPLGNPEPVDLSGFEPATVKHPVQVCDAQGCPTHGDAGRVGPCVQDATPTQHTWVTATDGDTGATLDWQHCGVCGVRRCTWLPGDATTACDHDPDCPTHGDDIARRCHGSAA